MGVLSLIAFGLAVATAYPKYIKTVQGAVQWGLWDSAIFLIGAAIAGLFAARRRPIPTPVLVLLWLLVPSGVVWAFVYLVVLGL
jgi:hypothetical protein